MCSSYLFQFADVTLDEFGEYLAPGFQTGRQQYGLLPETAVHSTGETLSVLQVTTTETYLFWRLWTIYVPLATTENTVLLKRTDVFVFNSVWSSVFTLKEMDFLLKRYTLITTR